MDTLGMPPTSDHQSNLLSRAFAALDRMRERRLPVRHTLEALLKSTVLDPEGVRVSAPIFPQVSTHHELKYSGPMDSGQAMALAAVISARPGILIHLNICGKRLGDKGTEILAPVIPAIRSVDLRRNNIGDRGVHAIVAAWKNACLIQLETLSLAGNRVGDSGANALSSMLEDGGDAEGSSPGATQSFVRWLSLAGNPRVSAEARERLLQAAANKRNGASNVPRVVV